MLLEPPACGASMRGEKSIPTYLAAPASMTASATRPGPQPTSSTSGPEWRATTETASSRLRRGPRRTCETRSSARACRSKSGVSASSWASGRTSRTGTRRYRAAASRSRGSIRLRRVFCQTYRHASRTRSRGRGCGARGHAQRLARELVGMEVEDRVGRLPADVVQPAPQHRARRDTPVGAAAQREHDPAPPADRDRNSHSASSSLPRRYGCAGIGRIRFGVRGES